MSFHLRQGSGGSCFTCGTCASGQITGFVCVSRTGSGNLRGYSKYLNFNSGDWNTRKATRATVTTTHMPYNREQLATSSANCTADTFCGYRVNALDIDTVIWNVATNARTQGYRLRVELCGVFDSYGSEFGATYDAFIDSLFGSCVPSTGYLSTSDFSYTRGETSGGSPGSCINPSAHCCSGSGWKKIVCPAGASATLTLVEFDTVAAAQARGSPTVGSSCQTLPGTIGSTGAGSATQIALGSATCAVVATITCTGLTIASNYEITASLTRRDSGTDAFISTTTVTITFTADGTTDTVDYNVPNETGTKVNFDSADSIVAV